MHAVLRRVVGQIVMLAGLCTPVLAQDRPFDLVAPEVSASELDATTALPGQFSRVLTLPFEQVCEALVAADVTADEAPPTPGACSGTSDNVFTQARSLDGAFNSIRFKLSTSVQDQTADLARLGGRLAAMADALSITLPGGFAQAVLAGIDMTCARVPLHYEFWRESGAIPRYNLVIKRAMVNEQTFSTTPQICAES